MTVDRYHSAGAGVPRVGGIARVCLNYDNFGQIARNTRARLSNRAGDDYTHVLRQAVRWIGAITWIAGPSIRADWRVSADGGSETLEAR